MTATGTASHIFEVPPIEITRSLLFLVCTFLSCPQKLLFAVPYSTHPTLVGSFVFVFRPNLTMLMFPFFALLELNIATFFQQRHSSSALDPLNSGEISRKTSCILAQGSHARLLFPAQEVLVHTQDFLFALIESQMPRKSLALTLTALPLTTP